MRILFAHNRYQYRGGEDLAVAAEIELLEQHGHAVGLFEADNAAIVGVIGKTKAALQTVYGIESKRQLASRIAFFRPDVVHVHNFFPLLSPSIYGACYENDIPVTQSLHNYRLICPNAILFRDGEVCEDCIGRIFPWPSVLHGCYRDSRPGSAIVAAMLTAHRIAGTWRSAVDAYIARTNFSRDKLVEGGLPAEKIAVIPSFAPDPGPPCGNADSFVLYAGRLSAEKGIRTLLSVSEHLKGSSLNLKIVGEGPLENEVSQAARQGKVQYLGSLSRQAVQSLMREAALLIFPSVCYENFPLAIVEAFAAGIPVIASRVGAMVEIIEDGRTGLFFRPGDAEDMAAKLDWASGHPEELALMRREARAEYLSKYTPERNYQLMIELYERATSRRHCPVTQ